MVQLSGQVLYPSAGIRDERIHRTVIKLRPALSTITGAMYNEPLTFDVVAGSSADIRILRLHGPITLSNMFEFQKVLVESPPKVTIVDFTESPYMDSAGLGILLNYYVSGKRHGRHLRLVGVNYRVAALLELTGAHKLVNSYDSIEAAEAATE
jgi:anti-anti-sigma factor